MTLQDPLPRISISEIDPTLSVLEHAVAYGNQGFLILYVWAPTFGGSPEPTTEHPTATGCTCKEKTGDCSIGKHPVVTAWQKLSTHEENKLRDQYSRLKKRPNIAIQLGTQANGTYIIAIDVDNEDRYRELVEELGPLTETARCESGRGYRLFYTLPDEVDPESINNAKAIGGKPGVDVKAKNGYVVVAPSWHSNGKQYRWIRWRSFSVLPLPWALKIAKRETPKWVHKYTPISLLNDRKGMRRAEKYLYAAVTSDCAALAACKTGSRNNSLYNMAVSLFSLCAGMSHSKAVPIVHENLASAAKQAGLSEREIYKTLRSADQFVAESGAWRVPRVLADPAPTSPGIAPPPDGSSPSVAPQQQRPVIRMTTELHEDTAAAIQSLRVDPNLYQREGALVQITRVSYEESENSPCVSADDGTKRHAFVEGSPLIRPVSIANLRKKMTCCAIYQKYNEKASEWRPALPTDPIVTYIHSCHEWPTIRPLLGITEAPTMRPDGSIVQDPGHDLATRYLYQPSIEFGRIQNSPSQEDARAAYESLAEVFVDFPYLNDSHKAVPIAAILTLVARPAIQGAVPAFLFDASTRGSGKTLQTDAVAIIPTGRGAPRMNFPTNEDEMEKVLGAYALRGAPFFCLDNVPSHRPFGGGPLDRVLTARDTVDLRVLGQSIVPTVEWRAVIMATGNNMQIFADTARRVLIARLEPKDEHPERRTNFHHEDLLGWLRKERARLVVAALTILRAYVVAGRPKMRCARWGSFEEWSAFIPHAILFAGGADPMLARPANDAEVDSETLAFSFVLSKLVSLKWQNFKIKTLVELIQPPPKQRDPEAPLPPDPFAELREAVETLCPPKHGKPTDARQVANKLRSYKGRYIEGHRLISKPGSGGVELWNVEDGSKSADHVSRT